MATRNRRMNFAENKHKPAISPGVVMILTLSALIVVWIGTYI